MTKLSTRRLLAYLAMCGVLALILAACSNAALFGLLKSKSKAQNAVKHSLVIFPFDRDSELNNVVPESFGASIAESLRMTLATSKGYSAYIYEDKLTPVQRAKTDGEIKSEDIKIPFFGEKAKTDKIAEVLSTDYYLVGSIESYTYDKEKKTADIALKADMIFAKTGKVEHEFVVGGSASAGNMSMDEEELRAIAAGKAVESLQEKILATSISDNVKIEKTKTKKK